MSNKKSSPEEGMSMEYLLKSLLNEKGKGLINNNLNIEYLTKKINSKERYKIALKNGIYIMNTDEKLNMDNIKKIIIININDIDERQMQKLKRSILFNDNYDNMGYSINESIVDNLINKANEKCKQKNLNAGDVVPKLLDKLSVISVYIRNHFTIKQPQIINKIGVLKIFNKNLLKDANNEIIKSNINYDDINVTYYINFLDNIYNKYGEQIKSKKLCQMISEIGKANNNETIFNLVKYIQTRCPDIKLKDTIKIMKYLNTEKSNNKEKHNERIEKIRDIFINIEEMEIKSTLRTIKKFSKMDSDKLDNYWLNYSDEKSSLSDTNIRLKNFYDKPRLKLKVTKEKTVFKRPSIKSVLRIGRLFANKKESSKQLSAKKLNTIETNLRKKFIEKEER